MANRTERGGITIILEYIDDQIGSTPTTLHSENVQMRPRTRAPNWQLCALKVPGHQQR